MSTPSRSPRATLAALAVAAALAVLPAAVLAAGAALPAAAQAEAPAAPPAADDAAGAARLDRRVAAFFADYAGALEEWERGGGRSGPHPAGRFVPRMEDLVAEGFDGGRLWLLDHLDRSALGPGERAERRRAIYAHCFEGDPDDPRLEAVALDLALHTDAVLPTRAEGWCRAVLARTARPGTQAAAMLALAGLLAPPGAALDEGRANEAGQLLAALQRSHAGTRAARAGQLALFQLLDRRYAAARDAWRAAWTPSADLATLPPHPAVAAWPAMEELARAGLGQATWWLVLEAPHAGYSADALRALRLELLEQLVQRHADEAWLADAVRVSEGLAEDIGLDAARELGRRLIAESENPEVRAWTLYGLGTLGVGPESDDAAVLAAIGYLERLRTEYPAHRLAPSVDGLLFGLRHLRVGSAPPDWEATDGDGATFRVSEARGRVTVIAFWGFWSAPSRELLPRLVALAERHAGAPLELVGVNTDPDPEAARARAAEADVRWRTVYEGSPGGAWAQAWGVRRFPRVLVLDAEGVVRASDPGPELEAVVAGLLAELKGERVAGG